MDRVVPFRRILPCNELGFDVSAVLDEVVVTWTTARGLPEGYEAAILDELERRELLGAGDDGQPLFDRTKEPDDFRRCVRETLDALSEQIPRRARGNGSTR